MQIKEEMRVAINMPYGSQIEFGWDEGEFQCRVMWMIWRFFHEMEQMNKFFQLKTEIFMPYT
jgi:hypothetical protein